MSLLRYYTIGAIVPDLGRLSALNERLEDAGAEFDSMVVLARRKDEELVRVSLPGARTRKIEDGLSRMQWMEFGSAYLGVTSVSVLLGAVYLPTGLITQAVMTLAAIVGLLLYHRQPRIEKKLLGMGLPENLAAQWENGFSDGFALALATVPEELFEEVQEAFLEDEHLSVLLAVDRRLVL